MRELNLNGLKCVLPKNENIQFEMDGECRMYPIPSNEIESIEMKGEYIFLNMSSDLGNAFYQFKLEEGGFLVGDYFVEDECVETIACHIFGEDIEEQ